MDKVSFTSDLAPCAFKKNHNAIKTLIGDEYKKWKPLDVITISAQTGSGKTSFILETLLKWVIELAQNKNIYHPIYYFVNRKILKEQLESTLVNEIQVQYDQCPRRVVVNNFIKIFTYQEVQEQLKIDNLHLPRPQHIDPIDNQSILKDFAFVIYDECHYFLSDSTFNPETFLAFSELIKYYDQEIQIYMSATIDDIRVWLDTYYKKSNMTVSNVMGVRNTSMPYIPVPFVSALRTIITDWNIHDYIGKSDYSFINLHAINDEDELPYLVKGKAATGKWLIFVNSKAYGDALYKELNKDDLEGDVVFFDAEYTDSEETINAVDEIITRKASSKRVVICTSVLDNGVSFFDTELSNIVVLTDMQEEFLQMFGRKRFDGNPVDLYICKRDKSFFSRRKRSVEMTRDVINRYRIFIETCNQPMQRQYLFNSILKSDYIYHQLRKFCYSRFGVLSVSPFSISRLAKMQEFYSEMEIAMDSSDDAFLVKQASWLGKRLNDIDQLSIKESPEWKHERIDVVLKEVADVAEITMDKKQNEVLRKKIRVPLQELLRSAKDYYEMTEKQADKEIETIGKGTISVETFSRLAKYFNLPFRMEKPDGSHFIIRKVGDPNLTPTGDSDLRELGTEG